MNNIPQHARLHDTLKKQIQKGMYKEGELLPSENDLCATYQLARSTVRQALTALVQEGYIKKIKGKGSVISSPVRSLGLLSFRGFSEVLGKSKQSIHTDFIREPYSTNWADDFFYALTDIEKKAGCIAMERIRYASNHPVMWEFTYLPDSMLPGFLEHRFVNNSLFQTLSKYYQIEIMNLEQDIRAIEAGKIAAKHLKMKPGKPLIHINRRYLTNHPKLNVYSSLYCNTEKFALGNNI